MASESRHLRVGNYLLFGGDKGLPVVSLYTTLSFFFGLLMIYLGHRLSEFI
ncbi:MAG: hypothetical protein HDS43_06970 [Bacteroides sp.]|nr:hypothetical protein [Bacteroides sp.]